MSDKSLEEKFKEYSIEAKKIDINIENDWQHFLTFKAGYHLAMEEINNGPTIIKDLGPIYVTAKDPSQMIVVGDPKLKKRLEDAANQVKYLLKLLELENLETRAEYFDAKELLEKLANE